MQFEHTKKLLKDGYEEAGFDVTEELASGETVLRYPVDGALDVTLKITDDDIQEYAEMVQARHEFRVVGNTGMVNTKFREQLLTPLDAHVDERDLRDFFFKKDDDIETYVELDRLSLVYANFFRFDPGYMRLCVDRLFSFPDRMRQQSIKEPLDIRHTFVRPLGIRVFKINANDLHEAEQISTAYIDSSLFTLAYEYKIPMMLANVWPETRFERHQRVRQNAHRLNHMIMPDDSFRSDLVRLYQAGLASQIPAYQFLSYYQILELFFQDVEHAGAMDALYTMLNDEDFRPNHETLTQIVAMVKAHESGVSQAQLLEQLLRQYIGSRAIREYIELTTGKAEESVGSIARRLTQLHDAITRAKQEVAPLSVDSPTIARDVPLVKFLAERVIIATREE